MISHNITWKRYEHFDSNRISYYSYKSWASASFLVRTHDTSLFGAFPVKEFYLASTMVGDEVIGILKKISWTFSLHEVWQALQAAPLLKFRMYLIHASSPLSDQTAIGFPASMINNSQLLASIWWTGWLTLAQGNCKAKWIIASQHWLFLMCQRFLILSEKHLTGWENAIIIWFLSAFD